MEKLEMLGDGTSTATKHDGHLVYTVRMEDEELRMAWDGTCTAHACVI